MELLYITGLAIAFSLFVPKPKALNRKPFTCPFCLTTWLTLIYQFTHYNNLIEAICIPFSLGLLASFIENLWKKTL